MKKIKVNKAQCPNCDDIIISKHRHHFNVCSCWKESEEILHSDRNKHLTHKQLSVLASGLHGIAVDGGTEYLRRLSYGLDIPIELSEYYDEEEK